MPLDVAAYRKQFLETYGERLKGISPALVDLYLLVAERGRVTISELKGLTKVGRFTLNNMIQLLGRAYLIPTDTGKQVKVGYGLILLKVSLENRREREVVLSNKGKQIFKELKALVEPSE